MLKIIPVHIIRPIKKSANSGFSLIEMIVAIMIFTLVIGSITGMFISSIRSQSKILATQKLLDETSYVMEYMSRTIRMAQKDVTTCGMSTFNYTNPPPDLSSIKFRDMYGGCETFFLGSDRLKETKTDLGGTFIINNLFLISDDFQIPSSSLKFNITGDIPVPDDKLQPRVTIAMTIKKAGAAKPEIKIQTTVSQRNLDL